MYFTPLLVLIFAAGLTNAFFNMGVGVLTTQRLDPIVTPGKVAGHVHTIFGGSNFGFVTDTASLRKSECTTAPIAQDKSAYWAPTLYFHWANDTFSSVDGGGVMYYLDDVRGGTTAFPDNFRMVAGDTRLRSYNASNPAQQAVKFRCLNFNGESRLYPMLPQVPCPNGIRAEINFFSCWNGRDTDSPDHKSHVAYRSEGPDRGSCNDPRFPVSLARIFLEIYWGSDRFDQFRHLAKNPTQPFVFSNGDPTGYGWHADFVNGWDAGVLDRVFKECDCINAAFGAIDCCVNKGVITKKEVKCRITNAVDEVVLGTVPKLPGANPVQPEGKYADVFVEPNPPHTISPVHVYYDEPPGTRAGGIVVTPTAAVGAAAATDAATTTIHTTITSQSPAATTPPAAATTVVNGSAAPPPPPPPPPPANTQPASAVASQTVTPTPSMVCGPPPAQALARKPKPRSQAHRRRMVSRKNRRHVLDQSS